MSSGSAEGADGSRPARRQAEIAAYVVEHGSVSANELVEAFGVSVMTVHRDLDELERQGVVRKYRGGVSAQPTSVFESNVAYRLNTAQAEKAALARHAREHDRAGDVGDAGRLDQRARPGRSPRGHHAVDRGNELPAGASRC